MNKELIKAMKNEEKNNSPSKFRVWWNKNGLTVKRIIFFPLWLVVLLTEFCKKKLDERIVWSDERTDEIFNYYLPKVMHWNDVAKQFYFFDNGHGWSMYFAKKRIKLKDRLYWKKYSGFWGGKLRDYLMDNFELDGFTKELGDCSDGWTEIFFRLNT